MLKKTRISTRVTFVQCWLKLQFTVTDSECVNIIGAAGQHKRTGITQPVQGVGNKLPVRRITLRFPASARDSSRTSRSPGGPPSPLLNVYCGYFPRGKGSRGVKLTAHHSSTGKVNNAFPSTCTPPHALMACRGTHRHLICWTKVPTAFYIVERRFVIQTSLSHLNCEVVATYKNINVHGHFQ